MSRANDPVEHRCTDKDGNLVIITTRNLGYLRPYLGYVLAVSMDGIEYRSVFRSPKHMQFVCPTPDLRLAHDQEFIEELGLFLED